ncbi:MAG: hypothetical protein SGI89_06980 [bacterium]|nr:hypothetical protein [bacterium]
MSVVIDAAEKMLNYKNELNGKEELAEKRMLTRTSKENFIKYR